MNLRAIACFCILSCLWSTTQSWPQAPAFNAPSHQPYYLDFEILDVRDLLPEPPSSGSATTLAELRELHRLQDSRTPEQARQAKADEMEEDIFAFSTVLGGEFSRSRLPLTAALGDHLKNEQAAVGARLKELYHRPRPYQADPTLHPVCAVKPTPDSYPSGHALTGYLEALALANLLPTRRDAILRRADEYAENRLICGVHHRSDIEASRSLAYAIFGYLTTNPTFQHDMAAARAELQAKR